jgi:hypothetical protein
MRDFATNLLGERVEIRVWRWDDAQGPPPEGRVMFVGTVRGIGIGPIDRNGESEIVIILELDESRWRSYGEIHHGRLPDGTGGDAIVGFLVPVPWSSQVGVKLLPKQGATP